MVVKYRVTGMTCGGCANSVTNAIKAVAPKASIEADFENDTVTVDGSADQAVIAKAIEDAGFEYGGTI